MGAYVLTRLASQRPAAFRHLVLIDPVIMDPAFYEGEAAKAIPDPADHPVARRRNVWTDVEEMRATGRSEEHTSELQSLMRISYAVFCLKKKKHNQNQ